MILRDLLWLAPVIVGAVGATALLISIVRGLNSGTASIALVCCVALLGAGVFTKIVFSPKDGLVVETAQASANSLVDLKKAVDANAAAITELTTKLKELAAAGQKSSDVDPNLNWTSILQSTTALQLKNERNAELLGNVEKNNDVLLQNIEKLKSSGW